MTEPRPKGWAAQVLSEQRLRWSQGDHALAETYLQSCPTSPADPEAVLDVIYQEIVLREQTGEKPTLEEYLRRFPTLEAQLRRQFALHQAIEEESVHVSRAVPPNKRAEPENTKAPPATPIAPPHDAIPQQVGGYEIESELGRDGLGVVYKAYDPWLRRTVAIAMLRGGDHGGPDARRRFATEARATAQLQHPNIVQVFEVGEHQGSPFIVREYVEGPSLAARLAGNPLEPARSARLVADLARALQAAHDLGIIHRDLKPANISIANGKSPLSAGAATGNPRSAIPKIANFGPMRLTLPGEDVIADGSIVGAPSHWAPEQAAGLPGRVGPLADVYALGAILYECLTGRPPFTGTRLESVLGRVKVRDPMAPRQLQPDVPRDLETICLKCLEKEPRRRYASAAALADELERFLAGRPILARPIGLMGRFLKWARREPWIAGLHAAVALCSIVAVTALAFGLRAANSRLTAERLKRQQAEYQLTLNRVGQAYYEIVGKKPAWAEQMLEACPEELRRWEWYYLDRLRRLGPTAPLVGHRRGVNGVAIAPDGGSIASSSGDGTIRLWSPDGAATATLDGKAGSVQGVAYAADGALLAAAGEDHKVTLWDLQSKAKVGAFAGHDGPVACVAFHPFGQKVASSAVAGERPEEVLLWDRSTLRILRTLRGHAGRVVGLAYSSDGRTLATASHDGSVRLWNGVTGEERLVFTQHQFALSGVAFSPDGAWVASSAGAPGADRPVDGEVLVWETSTGTLRHRLTEYESRPLAVAFHPDGERLATGGEGGEIKLWDLTTGAELLTLKGHGDMHAAKAVMGLAFSPDGKWLVSGSLDETVRLWKSE